MRIFIFILLSLSLFISNGCSSSSKRVAEKSELEGEFKLKKDRSDLDALRKEIPEDIKIQNDESSYILSLFSDSKKPPQEISSKFNDDLRRKRDAYSSWERKTRESYTKQELRRREDYMNEARKRREDSSVKKMKPEERTRFYQDLEARRKEFFAGESDSRKSFEAELRQKRSDYDSQSKDLRGRFDQEFRAYYQDYNQKKKQAAKSEAERLKAGGAPAGFTDEDMKDIQSLPKGSQSPLYPSDGDGQ